MNVTPVLSAHSDTPPQNALDAADTKVIPPKDLEKLILTCLEDGKAEDVLTIDLTGKSSFADAMIIASGRSNRQVAALADRLTRDAKEAGLGRVKVEGLPQADWVLIDFGDVIVHLFRPEVRDFYNLEKMWGMDVPESAPAN